jgi:hypothetical protein
MDLRLVDVTKNKRNPAREKWYWNTYHCQNKVTSANWIFKIELESQY